MGRGFARACVLVGLVEKGAVCVIGRHGLGPQVDRCCRPHVADVESQAGCMASLSSAKSNYCRIDTANVNDDSRKYRGYGELWLSRKLALIGDAVIA